MDFRSIHPELSLAIAWVMISAPLVEGSCPFHPLPPGTTWHSSQSAQPIWTRVSVYVYSWSSPKISQARGRNSVCEKQLPLHYTTFNIFLTVLWSVQTLGMIDIRAWGSPSLCPVFIYVTIRGILLSRRLIYAECRIIHSLLSLLHHPETRKWLNSTSLPPQRLSFHSHLSSFLGGWYYSKWFSLEGVINGLLSIWNCVVKIRARVRAGFSYLPVRVPERWGKTLKPFARGLRCLLGAHNWEERQAPGLGGGVLTFLSLG